MSQKKMDAYKEAKKNKRQIEKKQKRNKILGWIFGILAALAVIAGSVFLIYYTNVMLPEKQAAEAAATLQEESQQADENAEGSVETEAEDADAPADEAEVEDTEVPADETEVEDTEVPADETEAEETVGE